MDNQIPKFASIPQDQLFQSFSTVIESKKHKFVQLITELEYYDFEERKLVVGLVFELLQNEVTKKVCEQAVLQEGDQIMAMFLRKYQKHDLCAYCGQYLRYFASQQSLVVLWQSMTHIKKLTSLIEHSDFNVQADALETLQEIYLFDRPADSTFNSFMNENKFAILETFQNLRASKPEEENYFAVRESLKLQYQLLREEAVLRDAFTSKRKFLCETLKLLDSENESIAYEAIATLSIFVLVGENKRAAEVSNILYKNREDLLEIVQEFQLQQGKNEDEKEEFEALRVILIKKLTELKPVEKPAASAAGGSSS